MEILRHIKIFTYYLPQDVLEEENCHAVAV